MNRRATRLFVVTLHLELSDRRIAQKKHMTPTYILLGHAALTGRYELHGHVVRILTRTTPQHTWLPPELEKFFPRGERIFPYRNAQGLTKTGSTILV